MFLHDLEQYLRKVELDHTHTLKTKPCKETLILIFLMPCALYFHGVQQNQNDSETLNRDYHRA